MVKLQKNVVYSVKPWEGMDRNGLYLGFEGRTDNHIFGFRAPDGVARRFHIKDRHVVRVDDSTVVARRYDGYSQLDDAAGEKMLETDLREAGLWQ